MTLYHGTNVDFAAIDLTRSNPWKDFGQGFYLTEVFVNADRMAYKKQLLFGGEAVVIAYEFDEGNLTNGALSVLSFDKPTKEWAQFIYKNRNRKLRGKQHSFDVVYGPIADDGVAYLLNRYEEGLISIDELAQQLEFRELSYQYFFGTQRAIDLLRRI